MKTLKIKTANLIEIKNNLQAFIAKTPNSFKEYIVISGIVSRIQLCLDSSEIYSKILYLSKERDNEIYGYSVSSFNGRMEVIKSTLYKKISNFRDNIDRLNNLPKLFRFFFSTTIKELQKKELFLDHLRDKLSNMRIKKRDNYQKEINKLYDEFIEIEFNPIKYEEIKDIKSSNYKTYEILSMFVDFSDNMEIISNFPKKYLKIEG